MHRHPGLPSPRALLLHSVDLKMQGDGAQRSSRVRAAANKPICLSLSLERMHIFLRSVRLATRGLEKTNFDAEKIQLRTARIPRELHHLQGLAANFVIEADTTLVEPTTPRGSDSSFDSRKQIWKNNFEFIEITAARFISIEKKLHIVSIKSNSQIIKMKSFP